MGIGERRQREKIVQQEAILSAAQKLIEEEGVEGLTMRKLAEAVEYSPCVLYQHYASKQAILNALFVTLGRELLERLQQVEGATAEEKLSQAFLADIAFMLEKPWRVHLMHVLIGGVVRQEYPTIMQEIATFFAQRISALGYPALRSKQQVERALDVLRSLLTGVLQWGLMNKQEKALITAQEVMQEGIHRLLIGWKEEV